MSKPKHFILAMLAVTCVSTAAWAFDMPSSSRLLNGSDMKAVCNVQWTGETVVTYSAQPQTGLSASYVDANSVTHTLQLTFTNGIEEISSPNYPVNAGTWNVTAHSPQPGDQLNGATATLTILPAPVYVTGAAAELAKFADGTIDGVVTEQGTLHGVLGNDNVSHITTAIFSDFLVGEGKTITLWYALVGDTNVLANYILTPNSVEYTDAGIVIPNMLPNPNAQNTDTTIAQNGIDLYAYGYCSGSNYNIRYHLISGNPDQYSLDFANPSITDVDWTNLSVTGANGIINVNMPVDLSSGDYAVNIYFRDSRFPALISNPIPVSLHVNLPETYTMPLFDNVIALVDTCHCFTNIQWYHRANAGDEWAAIPGATDYYYREEGGLTGEYFVRADMNGVQTYTCPQSDVATLISDDAQPAKIMAYPNPTSESVTVAVSGSRTDTHLMSVINTMGVEMESRTFEGDNVTIDMRGYQKGNYMVSVDGMVVRVIRN